MYQQVNFYRTEFMTRKKSMGSGALLGFGGVVVFAMIAAYLYGTYEMMGITSRLKLAKNQEVEANQRLENFRPDGGPDGQESWSKRLETAKQALRDQELVLTMVVDSSLGNIDGFSSHLTALARQNVDGLWLSYIRLSALGDNTQIDGQALQPDLVPRYLQSLALEEPFADQRFDNFAIDRPDDEEGGSKQPSGDIVTFSLSSDPAMLADAGGRQ